LNVFIHNNTQPYICLTGILAASIASSTQVGMIFSDWNHFCKNSLE
jgi:hypothetical protein